MRGGRCRAFGTCLNMGAFLYRAFRDTEESLVLILEKLFLAPLYRSVSHSVTLYVEKGAIKMRSA